MIITVLLTLIALAVFTQPNAPRLFAALMFVGLTLSHEFLFSDLDGLAYYGSAALLDLLIIIATSGINPVPKMVINLHRICFLSIIINCAGYFIWLAYLPPTLYDISFMAIYTWTLITLIQRDGVNVAGGFTVDSWNTCFHFNWRSRIISYYRNGRQT